MLKAILFDLDDTLLGNKTERFLQAYFGALGEYAKAHYDVSVLMPALLRSTQHIITEPDLNQSNADQFWGHFSPQVGVPRAELEPFFYTFYQEQFPKLCATTHQRPVAQKLVAWCLAQEIEAVVATNPLFPAVAIEERLKWAGFPHHDTSFSLITTMENMVAAKPHAAYYTDILERIDCEPQEVLMVGDDMVNDIMPASSLGCHTFWLDTDQNPNEQILTESGTLTELFAKLQTGWLQ